MTESGLRPIEVATFPKDNFFLLLLFFLAGGVIDGSVWGAGGGMWGVGLVLTWNPMAGLNGESERFLKGLSWRSHVSSWRELFPHGIPCQGCMQDFLSLFDMESHVK